MSDCVFCGHSEREHEPQVVEGGRCFAGKPGGKAKPCPCEACEGGKNFGHEPRCGCRGFVRGRAPKEVA